MREMKDSGIEWIGEIPENWKCTRGKNIFKQRSQKGNTINLQLLSPTQKFGVIPQSLYEELTLMNAVKLDIKTNLMSLKTIYKGDFCISLRSFQGGFEYSLYDGVVSPAYQVFYAYKKAHENFYKYLFKDNSFIKKMNSYTMSLRDGKNLSFFDFGNTYIPYPPIDEQQKIADFLDKKCSEIDCLITDIKSQLEILEQYKKSIITEVVTKGLDKNVQMKDSGIEWIGEIPSHWDMEKFKYNLYRRSTKNIYDSQILSLYRELGVIPKDSRDDNHNVTSEDTFNYRFVRKNDFVVNKMKAWQGSVAVSEYEGVVSPAYFVYAFSNLKYNKRYFHYLLRDKSYANEFKRLSGGIRVGQWDLPSDSLENILIIIPPIDEQQKIANFLDEKCTEIEETIIDKQAQISTIEEYKKSMIFEYVTGKKEAL